MSLRDCIARTMPKSKILRILDDKKFTEAVIIEMQNQKGKLKNLVQDARIRKAEQANMENFTQPGIVNPKQKVHSPSGYLTNKIEDMGMVAESITAGFHKDIGKVMRAAKVKGLKGTLWGMTHTAWNKAISIAIHGGSVADEGITAFGKAWKQITKDVIEQINAAGGSMHYREDFALPHVHSADLIRKAGRETWGKDVTDTFKVVLDNDLVTEKEVLDAIYDNILDPTSVGAGVGKTYERKLVAKSGEDWFNYNEKYGEFTVFDTIVKYLDKSGKNIAAMQMFGANPREMVKSLSADAAGIANKLRTSGKPVTTISSSAGMPNHMYQNIMGFELPGSPVTANAGQWARTLQVVKLLALASLTATTDTAFSAIAAGFKGMPILRTLKTQLMEVATKGNTEFISQMGVISDIVANHVYSAHRFAEAAGNGAAMKIANAYIKAIGLNRWTQAMKVGHAYELLAHLTNMRNKSFSQLSDNMRLVLKQSGIGEIEWNYLATSPTTTHRGATFLDISNMEQDKRILFSTFLQREARYAVPEATTRSRAALNWGHAPGTFAGEVLRTTTQFKSFPVSVTAMQFGRIRSIPSTRARAFYTSNMLVGTTAMGIMATWLHDLAHGDDPQDITPQLVFKGTVRGGGTGVMMDIVQGLSYSHGAASWAAGPTVGMIEKLWGTLADIPEQGAGDFSKEMVAKTVEQGVKSSSFYGLLYKHLMLDGLERWAAPEYTRKKRTKEKTKLKKRGSGSFIRERRLPEVPDVGVRKGARLTF